jgi:hypothetical protein
MRVGQRIQYKDGQQVYTITRVYHDGAVLTEDSDGDEYTIEKSEFKDMKKVK